MGDSALCNSGEVNTGNPSQSSPNCGGRGREKKKKKKILHNAVWIGPEGHPTQACGN